MLWKKLTDILRRIPSDRSLHKALSWRFVALIVTLIIVFAATGSLVIAGEIGLIDTFIKIGLYVGHEKIWLKIGAKDVRE